MLDGLVSVIMPSWNTEKFIAASIDSVLAQTYANWELIVVDDCSTDSSAEIIRSYNDKRIRLFVNEQNSGAAISRNRALREAKGEWIAFLDSDDLWIPDKLEHQLRFMHDHGYCFSYTEYERIDEEGKPLGIFVSGPEAVNKRKMYMYDYIGQLTMMYNAKVFRLIQIKDIKKNNDYAIRLQLYKKKSACCYLLRENLAKYRVRAKSISHDIISKRIKSHYDLFHYCDEHPAVVSFLLACGNIGFGILKKIRYEYRK